MAAFFDDSCRVDNCDRVSVSSSSSTTVSADSECESESESESLGGFVVSDSQVDESLHGDDDGKSGFTYCVFAVCKLLIFVVELVTVDGLSPSQERRGLKLDDIGSQGHFVRMRKR